MAFMPKAGSRVSSPGTSGGCTNKKEPLARLSGCNLQQGRGLHEIATQRALVVLMFDGPAHQGRRAHGEHGAGAGGGQQQCHQRAAHTAPREQRRVAKQLGWGLAGVKGQGQLGTGAQVEGAVGGR